MHTNTGKSAASKTAKKQFLPAPSQARRMPADAFGRNKIATVKFATRLTLHLRPGS